MPVQAPTQNTMVNRIVVRIAGAQYKLTDFTVISVIRTIITAFVGEFSALWNGLVTALRDWYIQTASGAQLDRRLADYGLTRPPAISAYGQVAVAVDAQIILAAGTLFKAADPSDGSAPAQYQLLPNPAPTADEPNGSWLIADTRLLDVRALIVGSAGNAAANTIVDTVSPVEHITSVSNPTAIENGKDAATDEEFRTYFRSWLLSLTRGTASAILAGITNFTSGDGRRVHSAAIQEWDGVNMLKALDGRAIGLRIFVDEGTVNNIAPGTPTAGATLVTAVRKLVDGDGVNESLRSAGTPTEVRAATAVSIPVSLHLKVRTGANPQIVAQRARDAILSFFSNTPVAGRTLSGDVSGQFSLPRLFSVVDSIPDVLEPIFASPTTDLPVPIGSRITTGNIIITTGAA